ncbi:MAG: hypothetical protein LBG43_09790 [Treponema sp.]|nr:hypothetical protein [Treponema sp.]
MVNAPPLYGWAFFIQEDSYEKETVFAGMAALRCHSDWFCWLATEAASPASGSTLAGTK